MLSIKIYSVRQSVTMLIVVILNVALPKWAGNAKTSSRGPTFLRRRRRCTVGTKKRRFFFAEKNFWRVFFLKSTGGPILTSNMKLFFLLFTLVTLHSFNGEGKNKLKLLFWGRGKITLLLSAHFRCLFIAIKRKRRSLHYMFNGNFIKIKYNSTFQNAMSTETTALTYNVRGEPN